MYKKFSNTRFLGKEIIYLPKCHSTNDIAAEMIRNTKTPEGTIIITDYQTHGKGQRGNTWSSTQGSNLLFSIIFRPVFLESACVFKLNMVLSLGIFDALFPMIQGLKIKWPNDIYRFNKKLGGILIENNLMGNKITGSVAGIGINVNQDNFDIEKAVSLKQILKAEQDRSGIFEKIIRGIDARYFFLKEGKYDRLSEDYLKALYRYGETGRFRSGNEFNGIISGIDDIGRLKIMVDGNLRIFGFREIEYLD